MGYLGIASSTVHIDGMNVGETLKNHDKRLDELEARLALFEYDAIYPAYTIGKLIGTLMDVVEKRKSLLEAHELCEIACTIAMLVERLRALGGGEQDAELSQEAGGN